MGLCSELALFKEVDDWKATDGSKVEKAQGVDWSYSQKETRRAWRVAEQVEIKLRSHEKYRARKINIKSGARKIIAREVGWKIATGNRKW